MSLTQTPTHTAEEDRTYTLYKSAGDLEMALESMMRRDPITRLTTSQVTIFNDALHAARALLPASRALREDLDEVDETSNAASAYRQLHLTLVPTLHNALSDDYVAL